MSNSSNKAVAVPLSIRGLSGQDVTLVFTNTTLTSQPMTPITLTPSVPRSSVLRSMQQTRTSQGIRPVPSEISEFNRVGAPALLRKSSFAPSRRALQRAIPPSIGASRQWYVHVEAMETRQATLVRSATRDGMTVNIWLEDGEAGDNKISAAVLDGIMSRFFTNSNAVYHRATAMVGQPWGAHEFDDLIQTEQPLDIVLVNFDRDQQPYGLMGYFWSYNNFKVTPSTPESNESLSVYLDTETIYRTPGDIGLNTQYNTLAHEFMHMVNFYQRGVLLDNTFETWLEETSALMLEDVLSDILTPGYSPIRDGRFPDYLNQSGFNCNLIDWDFDPSSNCFGYSIGGSFGAYLLRHYGIGFYQNLLRGNNSVDGFVILDKAIRDAGGPGTVEAIRRAALNAALLPASGSPAGFGMPPRTENGITLYAIDGPAYILDRVLPTSVPAELVPLGSFPVVRPAVYGTYTETVSVPPGTTLSIVVR
ncbi:M30 family zinc metallopeptidase [Comamonas thiooxydans]|nr:hemagglutinin [Comamonas thiooxydans]